MINLDHTFPIQEILSPKVQHDLESEQL